MKKKAGCPKGSSAQAAREHDSLKEALAPRHVFCPIIYFAIVTKMQAEVLPVNHSSSCEENPYCFILVDCQCSLNVNSGDAVGNQVFNHCHWQLPSLSSPNTSIRLFYSPDFGICLWYVVSCSPYINSYFFKLSGNTLEGTFRVGMYPDGLESFASEQFSLPLQHSSQYRLCFPFYVYLQGQIPPM
jgi:hypothetical protein